MLVGRMCGCMAAVSVDVSYSRRIEVLLEAHR